MIFLALEMDNFIVCDLCNAKSATAVLRDIINYYMLINNHGSGYEIF